MQSLTQNYLALMIASEYDVDMETAFELTDDRCKKTHSRFRTLLAYKLKYKFNYGYNQIAKILNYRCASGPYNTLKDMDFEKAEEDLKKMQNLDLEDGKYKS